MNEADRQKIIACWTRDVEDTACRGQMHVYIDNLHFVLDNCNSQCMIDVWKDNKYIASYTHVESFIFDLENIYCRTYASCVVSVSRKRKRE